MSLKQQLHKAILSNDQATIQRLVKSLVHEVVLDTFLEVAFDTDNLAVYEIVCNLIQVEQTAELEEAASLLMSQPFCHHPHAYERAYEHAKRAVELDTRRIDLKEYLLFFNTIPDKLMTDAEANDLAIEILKLRPSSQVAKLHLQ